MELPTFSHDDVMQFMVVEALQARAREEFAEAQAEAERTKFRKSHKGWDPFNNPQGG